MDAAFAMPDSSDYSASDLPKAIDLSHHLNLLARSRKANTLKSLYQYASRPGMIALSGGTPPPDFFPFETLSAEIQTFDSKSKSSVAKASKANLFSWLFANSKKPKTQHISVPKYNSGEENTVDIATLLQYSNAQGCPPLLAFVKDFTKKIYKPGYADFDVLMNIGATQGWNMVVNMLCERGDPILVEEWTYPGAMNSYVPLDCPKIPVKLDGEGIIPASLEKVLAEWDVEARGMKRPTLLYTVPTGQNPTGSTMLGARKKEIYDICCKYDVIICEDEPYYFLYADPWVSQKSAAQAKGMIREASNPDAEKTAAEELSGAEKFLAALPPSYLQYDTQGRVIRLDTFSKVVAPGSRLGWFTASPIFIERLLRATESSAQAPSGYAQAMVTTLLYTWKYDGFVRWLRGIKATYAMRRDTMVDAFEETFHLEFDQTFNFGNSTFVGAKAYEKTLSSASNAVMDEKRGYKAKKQLLSFVPPTAGMFLWIQIQLDNFEQYHRIKASGVEDPATEFMTELWKDLAENNVLVSPGQFFDGSPEGHPGFENCGYFRLSFSIATPDNVKIAVKTFYDILVKMAK